MRLVDSKPFRLVKTTATDFIDDNAPRLAAALAYYALLSLAPLIVLALAIAGLLLDEEAARGGIARELGSVVGTAGAQGGGRIVKNGREPAAGIVGTAFRLLLLLFGAFRGFRRLRRARVGARCDLGGRAAARTRSWRADS